ncbi:MAG: UvrB/UvrC motif-containing protein [Zavarzinella sp.]
MLKCKYCTKIAKMHITEIPSGGGEYYDIHLCPECADTYLLKTSQFSESRDPMEESDAHCSTCGMTFLEFRNTGRLGCPHDYQVFREELLPLLESIHVAAIPRHVGKKPRRLPNIVNKRNQLDRLKRELQVAVSDEAYETAAKLRDQIRAIETE